VNILSEDEKGGASRKHWEIKNTYRNFIGKPERKKAFRRSKIKWEIILKYTFKVGVMVWNGFN
jgi:hypothetical protein